MRKYMEKRLKIHLNSNRVILGQLRGYDEFMNLVVDDAVEVRGKNENAPIGTVLVRGNSVLEIEALESISVNSQGLGARVF